jgi:inhibitor of cysteine peptidase
MRKKGLIIKSTIMMLALTFVLGGCFWPSKISGPGKKPPAGTGQKQTGAGEEQKPAGIEQQLAAQSKIKKFSDLDELKEFLEQGAATFPSYRLGSGRGMANSGLAVEEMALDSTAAPQAMMKSEAGEGDAAGMGGVSDDFSKTNVQVEGVDEADIIKTDGKYVYAVVKNDLYIIDAYPADQADIVAKIAFKSRPQDIYLSGENGKEADRLVVFGYDEIFYQSELYQRFRRQNQFTFFKVFDITDKKNPAETRDLDFEGGYSNSRMIGDYVYFVTNNYNYYYLNDEMMLPAIIEGGEILPNKCAAGVKCFMPDVYYFDIPYDSYNFTTVTAVNVKDSKEAVNGDIYLLSGSQNMYVSPDNIYITYTKYLSEYQLEMTVLKEILFPRLSQKDREKIAKIEATENFILNPDEKWGKISQILERFSAALTAEEQKALESELTEKMKQKYEDISKELEKSVIHKIAINKNNLEYKTFGEVTGQVLNQFSMDENNGYFRIATTKNQTWSRYADETESASYSNLYVLDADLKPVGKVENLAEGERIYSVRFMQNRAYMVTFRQTDPLFVIDLTDPRAPAVLGKLKIPGFSSYLHPYDNTTLIGIGKDTSENEWGGVRTGGIKLSLFDVSDVSNPTEIDTYIMGDAGSDSIALSYHKAFLFSRDKNLLVIPASVRENVLDGGWGKLSFAGAAVFTVNKNGFELKGKIDHSEGGQPANTDYWRGYQYYDNTVQRSLYIGDVLYTFSSNYLKMNKLDDLSAVNSVALKKEKKDDYEIIN